MKRRNETIFPACQSSWEIQNSETSTESWINKQRMLFRGAVIIEKCNKNLKISYPTEMENWVRIWINERRTQFRDYRKIQKFVNLESNENQKLNLNFDQ